MATFPEALNTPQDFFIAADKATSALNSGIDDTVLSAEVTDGSVFPTGRFPVTIDNEVIIVASRAGNVLTLEERGAFGTTAAAHIGSALVNANFTAGHWNQLTEALVKTQQPLLLLREPVEDSVLADPPGAPTDGQQYVVAAPASGAWAGEEDKIARWSEDASAWVFIDPILGMLLFDRESGSYLMYGDEGWDEFGGGGEAADVFFNNSSSGATAEDVQAALDEIFTSLAGVRQFEISLSITGGMYEDTVLGTYQATRGFKLPANFTGSIGSCSATPSLTEDISIRKNGAEFAVANISGNVVSFTAASETTFDAGDIVSFVAGGDAFFDLIVLSLLATRT
ncbi:MAG: DUF2793 domain-containing protein [Hoeflea sp.]|jgi:hypothetical protein|uniref:DUF2793 domain-containing protein n=1 Tax=Hoeflea sp. TaxID=1940281 RepID=UPI0032F0082B